MAYSNGIRGARVDPYLCDHQSKKAFPQARASQLSGAKLGDNSNNQENVIGRKHLTKNFEDKVHSQEQQPSRRKSNPDAMKQSSNERVLLGKKTSTNQSAPSATWEGAAVAGDIIHKNGAAASSSAASSRRNSNITLDHFQAANVALPEQGASPKKGGIRFMSGPPEFVAEVPKPSIRHTHTVKNARGSTSTIGGLIAAPAQQQQNTINKCDYRRGASSATYNIITGQ